MEQNQAPQELLTEFCNTCWNFEVETQQQKYDILSASFKNLSVKEKLDIIPLLVDACHIYRQFIFLAENIFETLNTDEQHSLTIPMVFPTDTDVCNITRNEYLWRIKHNLPCFSKENKFFCPSSFEDLMGFKTNLTMVIASGTPAIFCC